jgi:hypothetical protein
MHVEASYISLFGYPDVSVNISMLAQNSPMMKFLLDVKEVAERFIEWTPVMQILTVLSFSNR